MHGLLGQDIGGFLYYGNCFSPSFYSTPLNSAVFLPGKSVVFNSLSSLFTPSLPTFSGKKLKVLNVCVFLDYISSAGGVRLLCVYRCLWPGGKQHLCWHGDVHEGGRACTDGDQWGYQGQLQLPPQLSLNTHSYLGAPPRSKEAM